MNSNFMNNKISSSFTNLFIIDENNKFYCFNSFPDDKTFENIETQKNKDNSLDFISCSSNYCFSKTCHDNNIYFDGNCKFFNNSAISQEFKNSNILTSSCSIYHSLFIDSEYNVWSVGNNFYGQLGNSDNYPVSICNKIQLLHDIQQVSCGLNHSLFLDFSGIVWVCGSNKYGEIGLGNDIKKTNIPTKLSLPCISHISSFRTHSLFLDFKGDVWACGEAKNNEFGTTNQSVVMIPIKIQNIPSISFLSAGNYYSLLIDNNNNVWGAGLNDNSCIGIIKNDNTSIIKNFTQIPNISDIIYCIAGYFSIFVDSHANTFKAGNIIVPIEEEINESNSLKKIKDIKVNVRSYTNSKSARKI